MRACFLLHPFDCHGIRTCNQRIKTTTHPQMCGFKAEELLISRIACITIAFDYAKAAAWNRQPKLKERTDENRS